MYAGNNVAFAPSPDGNGNGLLVTNGYDLFGTGPIDAFVFYAFVGRPFNPDGDQFLALAFAGPTTMFASTTLPTNFNFLTASGAQFYTKQFFEADADGEDQVVFPPQGTIDVISTDPALPPTTAVPEPATLTLTAFGLAAVAARARRKRAAK